MKQEDKQLLLKDLSARLPYLPIVEISIYRDNNRRSDIELDPHVTENIWELIDKYHAIPYLRPMSSMTEEEKKELGRISCEGNIEHKYGIFYKSQDYLNSIHVDYRDLIPMGLAIEVTKENNPYEHD